MSGDVWTVDGETWAELQDFPMYAVSNLGRVMNLVSNTIKTQSLNQQGIPSVNLIRDGKQNRRSVAVLVAREFLPPHDNTYEAYDTPINLDGDRLNNRVDNLMWRPRWFAVVYHQQLKNPVKFGFHGTIELVDTGEVFENIRDCATKYGLLEKQIILAAHNQTPVPPYGFMFRLIL